MTFLAPFYVCHLVVERPNCVRASVALSFFFNDTATTEIYTLSLHDALPICEDGGVSDRRFPCVPARPRRCVDRKSTRLNSSHTFISYAVFCLKKKTVPP